MSDFRVGERVRVNRADLTWPNGREGTILRLNTSGPCGSAGHLVKLADCVTVLDPSDLDRLGHAVRSGPGMGSKR